MDDATGRVELAALLPFGTGELREEVFVDAAQDVFGAVLTVARADGANQIDQFTKPLLVEHRPGVLLGQHALEAGVVAFDRIHRPIDQLADVWLLGLGLQEVPAGLGRNPEDTDRTVFVRVFRGGPFALLVGELRVHLGERVGNILQEDQPQHNVLVLGCVQVVAELVGGKPERLLEAKIRPIAVRLALGCSLLLGHFDRFPSLRVVLLLFRPALPPSARSPSTRHKKEPLFYRLGGCIQAV